MALGNTVKSMKDLLEGLCNDLEKAANGNKAASQRVRTCSIKFEKIAKLFRKESVASEKKGGIKKKVPAKMKTAKKTEKKVAKKNAPAKRRATATKTVKKKK